MTKTITTCYCDRCGEKMPNRLEYGYGTHPNTAIEILRDKWEYADLCDKCKESFKAWWENIQQARQRQKGANNGSNENDTL